MLKKLLLLGVILSIQILNAFTLVPNWRGKEVLKINPNFHNERRTDWIAVYPKGSSTDWENVIKWQWVTDIGDREYTIPTLKNGDYEVRYFKNNSYTISDSYALHIDHDKPRVFHKLHKYKNGYAMVLINDGNLKYGEKDWIAYYKKGTSTAWKNVLKWHWVKDLRCNVPNECHDAVPPEDLAPGEYELRYFKNNSFTIYGEPLNVKINKVDSTLESIDVSINNRNKKNITIYFDGLGKFLQPNPKDWIGLYPVQSTNAWENVVQWAWAKDINLYVNDKRYNGAEYEMKNIKPGRYEIRYFLNNSFKTYVKSKPFTIK